MIEQTRKQIDKIDDEIVDLYCRRMDLCKEIGLAKAAQQTDVNVPSREEEIMRRLEQKVPQEKRSYLKLLYNTVFSSSKAYQSQFMHHKSQTTVQLEKAIATMAEMPGSAKVACQGVDGAYSCMAAERIFAQPDVIYIKTFEGVFDAIEKGFCQYGVVPIENSNTGSILAVYDLIQKHSCHIVKSIRLEIKHVLAAKPGVELKDVKTVISHEQGLWQCANHIKKLGVNVKQAANTAVAARSVAEGSDNTVAVVCSPKSAQVYGLQVLQTDIQDNDNNYTRFICIAKAMEIYKGADKVSVMLQTAHTPGSLHKVLDSFSALNLNITKLESRPINNTDFEYLFYFDFQADVTEKRILDLIAYLENNTQRFVFLGSYTEIL